MPIVAGDQAAVYTEHVHGKTTLSSREIRERWVITGRAFRHSLNRRDVKSVDQYPETETLGEFRYLRILLARILLDGTLGFVPKVP